MPIHNPDRQGLIITGSDINIAGYGNNFVFDILSKPGVNLTLFELVGTNKAYLT